jgi:hypothetical protein
MLECPKVFCFKFFPLLIHLKYSTQTVGYWTVFPIVTTMQFFGVWYYQFSYTYVPAQNIFNVYCLYWSLISLPIFSHLFCHLVKCDLFQFIFLDVIILLWLFSAYGGCSASHRFSHFGLWYGCDLKDWFLLLISNYFALSNVFVYIWMLNRCKSLTCIL